VHSADSFTFAFMENTPTELRKKRLIQIGHLEGISYLLLLGVAMPLKYIFSWPTAVSVFGLLHGFLFVWFCIFLLWMEIKKDITLFKGFLSVLLSLLPFGTFYLERYVFRK
jgi:integral membrane protein